MVDVEVACEASLQAHDTLVTVLQEAAAALLDAHPSLSSDESRTEFMARWVRDVGDTAARTAYRYGRVAA